MFHNLKSDIQLKDMGELLKNSETLKKAKGLIKNGKFTDPDFPANKASIIGFGENNHFSDAELGKIQWLRPE